MHDNNLNQRIQNLEDRAALKTLVDTFSELADVKDVQKQRLVFTEDASVDSTTNGRLFSIKGRKGIRNAFNITTSMCVVDRSG